MTYKISKKYEFIHRGRSKKTKWNVQKNEEYVVRYICRQDRSAISIFAPFVASPPGERFVYNWKYRQPKMTLAKPPTVFGFGRNDWAVIQNPKRLFPEIWLADIPVIWQTLLGQGVNNKPKDDFESWILLIWKTRSTFSDCISKSFRLVVINYDYY